MLLRDEDGFIDPGTVQVLSWPTLIRVGCVMGTHGICEIFVCSQLFFQSVPDGRDPTDCHGIADSVAVAFMELEDDGP